MTQRRQADENTAVSVLTGQRFEPRTFRFAETNTLQIDQERNLLELYHIKFDKINK